MRLLRPDMQELALTEVYYANLSTCKESKTAMPDRHTGKHRGGIGK